MISSVETHTAGQVTRVVSGGLPNIPGRTIREKRDFFREKFESVRRALLYEPRGHYAMLGAVLTPPCSPKADFGAFFMTTARYTDMCGDACMGIITALIELGIIEANEGSTEVVLDTPAGLVTGKAEVGNGGVETVTLRSVPSFLYDERSINVPGLGEIPMEISFGGNFHAIVAADDIVLTVEPDNAYKLSEIGNKIKDAANAQMMVRHPERPYINEISSPEIYDKPTHPEARAKNVLALAKGLVTRSPCGTGTCARMAALWAKNELGLNEEFINESIIGTLFKGRLVSEISVGNFKAVVPEITGSAFITALSNVVIDPRDPLASGFLLT